MDHMTETSVAAPVSEPYADHLSPEEVIEHLESLTAADKWRLRLIERRRIGGTDFKEGDLYREAVTRAVAGKRKCPRGKSFVAFLAQTMRGIASHRRPAISKHVPLEARDADGKVVDLQIASKQLDPEATLIEQEATDTVSHIYDCLDGDEQAQYVILAISDGKEGKELRDAVGIDQPTYDYIMKRIRRVMRKKYPKGWPR